MTAELNIEPNDFRNIYKKRDLMLMTYFRSNARENLTRISRATCIPVSTIFDRLKEYERSLIRKHTTLIDFKKLGFDVRMNILFKSGRESREQLRTFLLKNENINSLFQINNGFDYMAEAIFRNISEMKRFMEVLEQFDIESKQELLILDDLKREEFLSSKAHAELLCMNIP